MKKVMLEKTMKTKYILCLALVLSGDLIGRSAAVDTSADATNILTSLASHNPLGRRSLGFAVTKAM
jgi:hypothetical protein